MTAGATVRFLARFCRDHPLEEKIFVCPSFVAGRQIGEALAREAGSWINLRFVTLASLAQETAALELARLGKRLVGGSERLVLADTLFRELKDAGRLEYFDKLDPSPGVARALLRAVDSLRGEGYASERIDPGLFAVAAKGRDLRTILGRYERGLEDGGLIDLPGLWALAAEAAGGSRAAAEAAFLMPADVRLGSLEKAFLEAASGGRCLRLAGDPVHGLERPRLYQAVSGQGSADPPSPTSDVERLAWLFTPEGGPAPIGDGSLAVFRAIGPMSECREILRRVLESGTAFDDVEIVCPSGPAYATVLHDLSVRSGLPATFADGLPLALTAPGRALAGLLDWIESGFLASSLGRLVESQDLRLPFQGPDGDLAPSSVSRHLREAMIGWGRERYVELLENRRRKLEARLRDPRADEDDGLSEEGRRDLERDAAETRRLAAAVRDFLAVVPAVPAAAPVPFAEFSRGLAGALRLCAVVRPDPEGRDGQALALVTAELEAMAEAAESPAVDLEASLDRVRTALASLTVGASAPRPGHVHVSSYASGGLSARPVTFVAGLDDAAFPGQGVREPVLLDVEREKLSPNLPTAADSLRERLYSMAAMLASLRGRVTFSYPAYDVLEEREAFPSSLVLQVHRLVSGRLESTYEDLGKALASAAEAAGRPDPSGFLPGGPGRAIDATDWWLGRLAGRDRPADGLAAVKRKFPELGAGIRARQARAGDRLTEYEGIVRLDRRLFDPLTNPELEVSASRLESLVKCPFGYFLKYVLGVEPPEELELDRSRWLDPLDRGSLIHDILYEFMTGIAKEGARPDAGRHGPLMAEIAERLVSERKREVPPPSEGVFERERLDIRAALDVFLRVESARPPEVRPLAFEKGFSGVPVEVEGGGSFRLKGRIDRIDRTGPDTFRILDYKTGSPRPYEDLVAFGRGRIIQHALYAVAAEKILVREGLADRARVTESGYSFPTRRGEGREILVPAFDRRAFRALLRDILALIADGYFATALKDECDYCDYAPVCGGRAKATRAKVEADPRIGPAFERLKGYE